MGSVETKILECTNEDCPRKKTSSTLANFNAIGKTVCPDCGEEL